MFQKSYIEVTQAAGRHFVQQQIKGNIIMLNLLKFNELADYSKSPYLAPEATISGQEAYQLYAAAALPLLEKAGSKTLFYGKCHPFLIGPEHEQWDAMLLVQHESVERFLMFADDEAYLKIAGHRTAALADSRLLPLTKSSLI